MLFDPLTLRGVTLRNRIGVSPMCQYSAVDGVAGDWHLVHLGGLAQGGAGLVLTEATAVEAIGRISPADLGLWDDGQIEPLARIARFVKSQGAVPGIQLAHAGRKGSVGPPWVNGGAPLRPPQGGWNVVSASYLPFGEGYPVPMPLGSTDVDRLPGLFAAAARRALSAGFEVVEIHAAHGYLLHQFLSPLSNKRGDGYGGPFDGRTRLIREVIGAVRGCLPERVPVLLRVSATDWVEGGWDLEQTVELARLAKGQGVDLVDCSSGGLVPNAKVAIGPGYQVPFAERVRREAGIATAAVGLITSAQQAEAIVAEGKADVVLMGRELLRNPRFPLQAAPAPTAVESHRRMR